MGMKIIRTKGICGGQPRVSGTRLTVPHILLSLAGLNGDIEDLLRSYPSLSKEAVCKVLAYAAREIER